MECAPGDRFKERFSSHSGDWQSLSLKTLEETYSRSSPSREELKKIQFLRVVWCEWVDG